jgi:farnesyl-diphosphate farnesyltransferase|tara:strand:+ start:1006 stop:2001 length:996 start_codon:yes stop_codon:yes gene_type:complete
MTELDSFNDKLLEGTSRSFYLTLKRLPKSVKGQIGLLYLLARISDTIADSGDYGGEDLQRLLEDYNSRAQGHSDSMPDFSNLSDIQNNPAEGLLLRGAHGPIELLEAASVVDQRLIRKCLNTIISGQRMDLERFSNNKSEVIQSLQRYEEMDDYAYRVAGSVGEFWTEICLEHAFDASPEMKEDMMSTGVRFGKALQLINILRDIPEDLEIGRCYIPTDDLEKIGLSPNDLLSSESIDIFRPLLDEYIEKAEEHLDEAVRYIGLLPHNQYRLRGACMIPVIIGKRTLNLLREQNVLDGKNRVKITRKEIKEIMRNVILSLPFRKMSISLLE